MSVIQIDTGEGPARVHMHTAERPQAALILGHGAAGGVDTPDLEAVTEVAGPAGFSVALVEQPYRVAGRRSSPSPERLDEAWTEVVEHLRNGELHGLPIVVGGRSAGARVACRTAAETGAVAVLCLAFPLHPPGRPEKSRQPELNAVKLPTLVVQGDRDQFGSPRGGRNRKVVKVAGNHSLRTDLDAVAGAVRDWFPSVLSGTPARS